MSDTPITWVVGSSASVQSVMSVIASYRRAQYFAAGSFMTSNSDHQLDHDENCNLDHHDDDGLGHETGNQNDPIDAAPPLGTDTETDIFQWDDNTFDGSIQRPAPTGRPGTPGSRPSSHSRLLPHADPEDPTERTPLQKKTSIVSSFVLPNATPVEGDSGVSLAPGPPTRRDSQQSIARQSARRADHPQEHSYSGKSTFGQTLFNAIGILLGIGVFSEPLAFAYAGWAVGICLITLYGFVCCYTAKILARIILDDGRLRSYADIGRKAFGVRLMPVTATLLFLELFTVSVVLVTLYADSMHVIIPNYSPNTYKIMGLVVLLPTVFLPLSILSYTSILGIFSIMLVIGVMFIDGLTKSEGPGSLWEPAETHLGIAGVGKLGVSFGLLMAGFSGHAVIPSLARDMSDPREFDRMINWAFLIATVTYAVIGAVGYLMFGQSVSDEISKDLMKTPGYDPGLNYFALWSLVVSPLSKFALATRPLNVALEVILGLDINPIVSAPGNGGTKRYRPLTSSGLRARTLWLLKSRGVLIERTIFTMVAVSVSILMPEFSSMMAFLGAFSAFTLCVIGPILAKAALAGWSMDSVDLVLVLISIGMAAWGTGTALVV